MSNESSNPEILKSERIPVKRLVSKRDIGIEAFELVNGNLMIESTFLDPYHLIRLNLHIEPGTKTILAAISEFGNYPHTLCPGVAKRAKSLIGLQIKRGIVKEVLKAVGGCDGCVHLKELAVESINFAATALLGYDLGLGLMNREFNRQEESKIYEVSKEVLKNTCFIYKQID